MHGGREVPPDARLEPGRPLLTARQGDILRLVAAGMSNRAIGERLGLSEQTVKNYLSDALRRLGVDDRTHAVIEAIRLGAIEFPTSPDQPMTPIPIEPEDG